MIEPVIVPAPPPRTRVPWPELCSLARRSSGAVLVGSWREAERANSVRNAGQAWLRRAGADDLRVVRRSDTAGCHVLICRADVERMPDGMPVPACVRVADHSAVDVDAVDRAVRTHNMIVRSAGGAVGEWLWIRGACWGIRHALEAFGIGLEEVQS